MLEQGKVNLPGSMKYGTLQFGGTRFGLLYDGLAGRVDVFTGGSVLGFSYPRLTTVASNAVCQFNQMATFLGDGIVPQPNQTFSATGITVTRSSNTGAILHTEEPKQKSDIRSAMKSLVNWWD